jgi:hypothetical protein
MFRPRPEKLLMLPLTRGS